MFENLLDTSKISEWFWEIIESAGKDRARLALILQQLTLENIFRFQKEYAIATLSLKDDIFTKNMDVGGSEGGIETFVNWIVSQGKDYYLTVWQTPTIIPPYITIESLETFEGVAVDIYEEKGGDIDNLVV